MMEWRLYPPHLKNGVRNRITELVNASQDKELLHIFIEIALIEKVPEHKDSSVADDEFHELITEIYAEYIKLGAVDG